MGYDIHWDTGFTLTPGGQYSLVNNVRRGHYSRGDIIHSDTKTWKHNPTVSRVELGEECMVIEDDDAKSHHRNESRKVWPRKTRFRMCGLSGGLVSRSQTLPARVWFPIT